MSKKKTKMRYEATVKIVIEETGFPDDLSRHSEIDTAFIRELGVNQDCSVELLTSSLKEVTE